MVLDSGTTDDLLKQLRGGNREALSQLLDQHRSYLRQVVAIRLDRGLRRRIDPSDVVQDALLEATRRIADYLKRQPMSFRLWLRRTTCQRLVDLRRQHLHADCRAVDRELPLPASSSLVFVRGLIDAGKTPSREFDDRELIQFVRQAISNLADSDREIVLMRNFEELSNQEVAQLLEIEPAAASKRYGRALLQLRRRLLQQAPSGTAL